MWEQTFRNMKKLVNESPHIFFKDTSPKETAFTHLPMLVTEHGKLIIRKAFQVQIIKTPLTNTKRAKSALSATLQALE